MSGLSINVRFAHPDAGYSGAQENARRAGLVRGKVYTIRSMHVGQSSTSVELYELPGQFGSEFFEPAEPGEPRLTSDDLRIMVRLINEHIKDHDSVLPLPQEEDLRLKHRKEAQQVMRKIRSIRRSRQS